MKYGVNTFIWSLEFDPGNSALLDAVKLHGFDGIEVPLFNPAQFPASQIRRAAEGRGLECTVCAVIPRGLSMVSDDPGVREKTRVHMADAIKATAELGAEVIAGPLYSPVGFFTGTRRTTDEWKRVVDTYRALAPVLDPHNVTIAVEPLNRFETYVLNTAEDSIRLVEEVNHPKVGILFDTFHANIEEKDIGAAYRKIGKHLRHVHTCENDRGIPGSGHVEWPSVFAALRDIGYDGWLTVESFGFSLGELSAAASIWRDIAPSPDSIAWEGVQFLKQNTATAAAH